MPPESNNGIQWRTMTAGIVDKVCCYAYSTQEIQTDERSFEVSSSSWDKMYENSTAPARKISKEPDDRLLAAGRPHSLLMSTLVEKFTDDKVFFSDLSLDEARTVVGRGMAGVDGSAGDPATTWMMNDMNYFQTDEERCTKKKWRV